jgi:glutathionylspermidine synthase
MTDPWIRLQGLGPDEFRTVRRRLIFDCCKWDPQIEDVNTLSNVPLVVTREAWQELTALGAALARETLAIEAELIARPELHARLGLPRAVRAALARAAVGGASPGVARLVRFDFHHTRDGWRISEANSDVPGGLNEASGFPGLMAPHYPGVELPNDPVDGYIDTLLGDRSPGTRIALLHATAYSDDHQMMAYLARRLRSRGALPMLASPAQVRWHNGRAHVEGDGWQGEADLLVRFFPGDWLADLPDPEWKRFYAGARTPISNPASAMVTQSKRSPLTWPELRTPIPTWRALLPETRDPREVPWRESDEWVVKPVLGRVGEDVAIRGVITPTDWKRVQKMCARHPEEWVAQRRFRVTPVELAGAVVYPCIGVYTVDDRVVGAYGRLATRELVDARAADAAVLLAPRAVA